MADVKETEAKVLRLVGERPGQGLTTEELTRLVGVTRQRVHQILRAHGYEVRPVWVRREARRGGKR